MRKAITLSLFSIFCAFSISLGQANAANVYGVKIWEQGVYDCSITSYKPSAVGGNDARSRCTLLEATRTVRARVGSHYGCKFELLGSPEGETVRLKYHWKFPRPGLLNPTTKERFLEYDTYWDHQVGQKDGYAGYTIDHQGELVPGTWTVEIKYEDRVLGSCTFEIRT